MVAEEWGGTERDYKEAEELLGVGNMFVILTVVMVSRVYTEVKLYRCC